MPAFKQTPVGATPLSRSTINDAVRIAKAVAAHFSFALPPWGHWTPDEWAKAGPEYDELRDCMLGWECVFLCRMRAVRLCVSWRPSPHLTAALRSPLPLLAA